MRSRRRDRSDAARAGRDYAELFSPLVGTGRSALEQGLTLYDRIRRLGTLDAVLAATALEADADGLVSADAAFAEVPRLRFLELGAAALRELVEAP